MAFARLLDEAKAETKAEAPSPIKLKEKRDTLARFASRLRTNDSMVADLLDEEALFESQRRLPTWDEDRDYDVDDRMWTRTGRARDGTEVTQTFLLDDEGRSICVISERRRRAEV